MLSTYHNAPPVPRVFVYQVEFNAIATGKIIAMSKRRIRWRFGFPNKEAIDSGASGTACRGEEHDVTLVWSVASGKRMIMSNGKQIYVGVTKTNIFEHQWTDLRGNLVKLVAHATAPISTTMGTRQYDLFINGKSFFTLPKTYEIGLTGDADSRIPGVISRDPPENDAYKQHIPTYSESGRHLVPHSQEEEMDDLKRAIKASLEESRDHLQAKGRLLQETAPQPVSENSSSQHPKEEEPLIDFFSDPISNNATTPENPNALVLLDSNPQQHEVDPFAFNTGPVYTNNAIDEFAPKPPTYNDISDQILLSYTSQQATSQHQQSPPQESLNTPAPSNPFDVVTQQNAYNPTVNHHYPQQGQQMPQYQSGYGFNNM